MQSISFAVEEILIAAGYGARSVVIGDLPGRGCGAIVEVGRRRDAFDAGQRSRAVEAVREPCMPMPMMPNADAVAGAVCGRRGRGFEEDAIRPSRDRAGWQEITAGVTLFF